MLPDSIAGLPLHPLVVHAAVVLLPLGALGVLLLVALPKLRPTYTLLVALGVTAGALSVVAAKVTGEMLAAQTQLPVAHANWANRLLPVAIVLAVLTWVFYAVQRRAAAGSGATRAVLPTGVATAIAAVVALVLTVLTGHSGSESVWGDTLDGDGQAATAAPAPTTPAATATATATAEATATAQPAAPTDGGEPATTVITLAEIATRDSEESCWAAVNGEVFDLTAWIEQHPGGRDRILGLCGTDATAAFTNQHGGQDRPNDALASFKIGTLG